LPRVPWVWPAAVAHYLRAHNVAPERGLVDHIRSQGAGVTDVGDDVREAAVAVLKGGSA
jgi:hypothetical protein